MRKISLFLLLFACFSIPAFAQNTVVISGTVTDMNSTPISGKSVFIDHDSTGFFTYSNVVTTDANGNYIDSIQLPPAMTQGNVYVTVYDCNQAPVSQTVGYNPGNYLLNNVDFQICNSPGGCTANFSSSPVPNSTQVNFSDLSAGAVSWAWDFGDGNTSTVQNPTHFYNSTGPFVVCLTITTASSCTAVYCDSVSLNQGGPTCNATLGATVSSNTASFNATATGTGTPVAYAWDFGDGNNSTGSSSATTHTYASNGTYNACVTVLFSDSCTATSCTQVVIGQAQVFCNAGFTGANQPTGFAFNSNSTSSGTILAYTWDFGDGNTATTTTGTTSHAYAGNGPYVACLTIVTSDSCSSTYCDTLVFNNTFPCQAGFFHYPDTTGQYTIIGVNTSTGTNLSYSWDFGDGNTSNVQFPIHQYAGAGTYLICLTVTSSNPACTSTYCDSVTVTQKMLSAFTFAVVDQSTSANPAAEASASLEMWPNPAHDQVSIRLELQNNAPVSAQIVDLQGRLVFETTEKRLAPGQHTFNFNLHQLPSGLYLARVKIGGESIVRKLMVD